MNFDAMFKTLHAPEERPLQGVIPDLLQPVLRHEPADLQRKLRHELWSIYAGSALAPAFAPFHFTTIYYHHDDDARTV